MHYVVYVWMLTLKSFCVTCSSGSPDIYIADLGVACLMLILNEATASEKGSYQPIIPRRYFHDKIILSLRL